MLQKHFIFDTETLGIKENAVVLSMACVRFTFEEKSSILQLKENSYYCKFSIEEQIELGRTIEDQTISWWKKQDPKVFKMNVKPSDKDVTIKDGFINLKEFLRQQEYDWNSSFCWSRGIGFDFPKLESLCDNIKMPVPFNTWKTRDIRTFIDILTGSIDGIYELQQKDPNQHLLLKHHSLSDCILDALVLQEIF